MERYFVVFFKGEYEGNAFAGNVDVTMQDEMYLNKRSANNVIKDQYGFDDVVITGFIELSAMDFEDWEV